MPTVDLTAQLSAEREALLAEMKKEGLKFPPKPAYDLPRLPLNLTDLDDDKIMRLLVKFTRYQDHLSGQLVAAEIDEATAIHNLEVIKATHLVKAWAGPSENRVAIQKAAAQIDPEALKQEEELKVLKNKRKLYGVLVETLARDGSVVSREITRRIGRADHERRVDHHTP